MQESILRDVVEELRELLIGRTLGKIFQLSKLGLAIDFRAPGGRFLFISVDASAPRLYMIERRLKDLEKQSVNLSPFGYVLRKQLGGATLVGVTCDEGERIARFTFEAFDALGAGTPRTLVVQLTGKSANLLILDASDRIIDTLRPPRGEGQQIGERYGPPPRPTAKLRANAAATSPLVASGASISQALDRFYSEIESEREFDVLAAAKLQHLKSEITKRRKLRKNLEGDLAQHGDAESHKRAGDLLLANISTAKRSGNTVQIIDYFDEAAPTLTLEIDENSSLQDEAGRRFARYTKAKRAATEIAVRLAAISEEIENFEFRVSELQEIIASRDLGALKQFDEGKAPKRKLVSQKRENPELSGLRVYRSTQGFEILVGRSAGDNDRLTFRVARPHDLWFHAADYPGSHVVVRNPARGEVPHRTILEAAQLAAYFSQARDDSKVNVSYTARKFLAKPKGGAPGLVRLSTSKTIIVEPKEAVERI
jgi:predicted ribosome quality control (RQC) complex YloA/Tae2 family protein